MWQTTPNSLTTKLKFKNFQEAFAFMTEVAIVAEKSNHHPTWTNTYNKLEIILCTHDAGNIVTEKDTLLAQKIEKIFEKYQ
jgi:4a-hydroxytetrahydrobiopterin dehydratase